MYRPAPAMPHYDLVACYKAADTAAASAGQQLQQLHGNVAFAALQAVERAAFAATLADVLRTAPSRGYRWPSD